MPAFSYLLIKRNAFEIHSFLHISYPQVETALLVERGFDVLATGKGLRPFPVAEDALLVERGFDVLATGIGLRPIPVAENALLVKRGFDVLGRFFCAEDARDAGE